MSMKEELLASESTDAISVLRRDESNRARLDDQNVS